MLSDTPRQKLAAMIALDGFKVASDAKLCEALLRDYCGEYRVEIAALTAAVRWGVPKSLSDAGQVPPATLRANLVRRLQENHGLAEDAAFWAVDAWTSILGLPSVTPADDESRKGRASDTGDTRSMPAGPVSPSLAQSPPQAPSPPLPPQRPSLPKPPSPPQWQLPPLPKPPSQPQSPLLPPLPKPPSEPQSPPPPRPPYQPQSPVLPPLPKPSQPQSPSLPPLPAAPLQPRSPVPQSLPFVAAARALENRETTAQLRQVQIYLKMQLQRRKSAALQEELRIAGVEALTARRLVGHAARSAAVKHTWIAMAIFAASLALMTTMSPLFGHRQELLVLCASAFGYLMFRGVRLIGTF
jgi:hypothetical protein